MFRGSPLRYTTHSVQRSDRGTGSVRKVKGTGSDEEGGVDSAFKRLAVSLQRLLQRCVAEQSHLH